jgi:hypothetical protein
MLIVPQAQAFQSRAHSYTQLAIQMISVKLYSTYLTDTQKRPY